MADRNCADCGKPFEVKHPTAKFCSPLCRMRAHRRPADAVTGKPLTSANAPEPVTGGTVTAALLRELTDLGLTDDVDGLVALTLARRLDSSAEPGAAIASLSRQFATVMVAVRAKGAAKKADTLDLIADRARQKMAGGA